MTYTIIVLSAISVPDAVRCTNVNCSDPVHIEETTRFYIAILASLQDASSSVFQLAGNGRGGNYSNKPGWADYVSDLYKESRDIGKMWCNAGKPRQGQIFELYRQSKSRCKYAIRYIKRHENSLRKESLARKLVDKNPMEFWKEVKHMNASNTPLPTCIDGISGADNIAQMWRDHYSDIFNSVNPVIDVVYNVDESTDFGDVVVPSEEVERAVRELVANKSCGIDGIYAEHMLYSSHVLFRLLGLCMSSFLVHGFLPDEMMAVALVPIIKSKSGRIMSKDNYRPIDLASIVSKVLEKILLNRLYIFLDTCSNQFGFKKKHSTDQCVFVLKELIDSYRMLNGSVFTCFLDASKAFDRMNHSLLFDKLCDRGVPFYLIRLLVYWYEHQRMCVRWGGVYSSSFTVTNGVRQGGILSPYLFNVYVDDLSVKLNSCHVGCYYSGGCINHLMYADDLVIMSPSVAGLNKLLHICESFGLSHDVLFSNKKSTIMSFRAGNIKDAHLPFIVYPKW